MAVPSGTTRPPGIGLSTLNPQLIAPARLASRRGGVQTRAVIASIAFRNFKALRGTRIALTPFNLVIGPNGSGKTSLIEALMRLRTLSKLPLSTAPLSAQKSGGPEIEFAFRPPHDGIVVKLGCVSEIVCDTLRIEPPGAAGWEDLRASLGSIRSYVLAHEAMARPAAPSENGILDPDGANLAAVLARMSERHPESYRALVAEMLRILPEFRALEFVPDGGNIAFGLHLEENGVVPAAELSQGMLYLLGMLALAFDPQPPRVLCIEEVDRGIHPRKLREIRDALYRLSYPEAFGAKHPPVQLVVTSHSPYFIDLFREHPEEIVIADKHGRAAHFSRLADRTDLPELLREGSLGDMWFSGILGGVPEERRGAEELRAER